MAGKLLAYMAHLDHSPPVVVQLRLEAGLILTNSAQVAHEFRRFYSDLYTSKTSRPLNDLHLLLQSINFPSLTDSQIELLKAPITEECIAEAIASLLTSKAPCSDGLLLEFYSQFQEILLPKLQALYSDIYETDTLPTPWVKPLLSLSRKQEKIPSTPNCIAPFLSFN